MMLFFPFILLNKNAYKKAADKIVTDFVPYWSVAQALVVYSVCGRSRPSGVLFGLNQVFSLGHDEGELSRIHKLLIGQTNTRVKRMIVESGKRNLCC